MEDASPDSWEAMLYSGKYTDFYIDCNGASFPVDNVVLARASDYFRALFDSSEIQASPLFTKDNGS